MSQDPLIEPAIVPRGPNRLQQIAECHIQALRDGQVLKSEHELTAALVVHLATIAGQTVKAYAAAQIARELREAIATLPMPDTNSSGGELAAYLESLGYGDE